MAKARFQGLFCEETKLPGARSKEARGQNKIKPKLQGLACKIGVHGWWVGFCRSVGVKTERKGLVCNDF